MTSRPILLVLTVGFWLVVGGAVVRSGLMIGPVTYHWRNLHQENATFHWAVSPDRSEQVTLPVNTLRTVFVTVPRSFTDATLTVRSSSGGGKLRLNIPGASGSPDIDRTVVSGEPLSVDVTWGAIAIRTRTFAVSVLAEDQPVTLRDWSLTVTKR